jgi:hypothetical protein
MLRREGGHMPTPRKFSAEEQRKLFSLLETPFSPSEVKWRVVCKGQRGRRGKVLPYADPRVYTDRLNQLFTPSGWSRTYNLAAVPNVVRTVHGRQVVTGKVLVNCVLTIHRLGSHAGNGEEWADGAMAVTSAEAQAFKRACSVFGLGRYLYRISERWVDLDRRGVPKRLPVLPHWALPPDVVIEHGGEPKGPIDPKLTGKIDGFRKVLGDGVYAEILSRAGFSHDARLIPNANRQKDALRWMEAAARGYDRVKRLSSESGRGEHLDALLQHMKLTTIQELPSLEALRFLVDTLESVVPQHAA